MLKKIMCYFEGNIDHIALGIAAMNGEFYLPIDCM